MVAYKGQKPATAEERAHMAKVKNLFCWVCQPDMEQCGPTEVHHIVEGNKRMGNFFVLPLGTGHHRTYTVNVTHNRRVFEQEFGTQRSLWESLNAYMGIIREWPASRIQPLRRTTLRLPKVLP